MRDGDAAVSRPSECWGLGAKFPTSWNTLGYTQIYRRMSDELIRCPRCNRALTGDRPLMCESCGPVGESITDGVLNFVGSNAELARKILSWPKEFVAALPALLSGSGLKAARSAGTTASDLLSYGLIDTYGSLTPLGLLLRYHTDAFAWQKETKGLDGIFDLSKAGAHPRILDVGCGACQTLRRLELNGPATLCGVDIDLTALAFGARLASLEGIHPSLACASAPSLPYSDKTFDLVITRVALNYMHQKSALREMARVLRPGGTLFCRVEAIWYDLRMIAMPAGWKQLICALRDLGWGTVHAVAGWQPTPGSTLRGGRAFTSAASLRRRLARYGCETLTAAPSPNGPTFAGRRTQSILVARKR